MKRSLFCALSIILISFTFQQTPTESALSYPVIGTFFVNWAQYRNPPYNFKPNDLSGIIEKVDLIFYGFAYFCPNSSMFQPYWVDITECNNLQPFEITWIEPNDDQYYRQIVDYKTTKNTNLKLLLSIGGWNFPSNFFSEMVSTNISRSIFIKSCLNWLKTYNGDGIDIDWEYPSSQPRTDYVKIDCSDFKPIDDTGGTCNEPNIDINNFVLLMKEMREAFNKSGKDYLITFCGQANITNVERGFNIKELVKYVDLINIMTYDYSVSNTNYSRLTAPNEPLYPPSSIQQISQLNINNTVQGYINLGAPVEKLNIGIAYYGHTWWVPGLTSISEWGHYGLNSTQQNRCCGPLELTFGCKSGVYTQQCGQLSYNEILNAGFNFTFDNETMTNIGYMLLPIGKDGNTTRGTWVTFQGIENIRAIIEYSKNMKLAGAFTFDITQDTYDTDTHKWTFELSNLIYQLLQNTTESN